MKKTLLIAIFMLSNFTYSQFKKTDDKEIIYNNLRIKKDSITQDCKCQSKITYGFNNISGDILLELKDIFYHFKRTSKFKTGVTSYNYSYKFADYISENGNKIVIQIFDNNSQGIRCIISDRNDIWVY